MSRREPILRATISALQPKGLDLTQYRRQGVRERRINLRPEDAAGAMAFSACDIEVNGEVLLGDSLRPRLLRLKAFPGDRESFDAAMVLLLDRHGFNPAKPEALLYAVVFVALFEWMNDACPKCRRDRRGSPQPQPCLECGQRREERQDIDAETGKPRVRHFIAGKPTAGCGKCKGMGRIFPKDEAPRGMVCRTCQNSGRLFFKTSVREKLVAEFYRDQMRRDLDRESYRRVWIKRHRQVLDDLRLVDAAIVGGIDLRVSPNENRVTVPDPREFDADMEKDEPVISSDTGLAPE